MYSLCAQVCVWRAPSHASFLTRALWAQLPRVLCRAGPARTRACCGGRSLWRPPILCSRNLRRCRQTRVRTTATMTRRHPRTTGRRVAAPPASRMCARLPRWRSLRATPPRACPCLPLTKASACGKVACVIPCVSPLTVARRATRAVEDYLRFTASVLDAFPPSAASEVPPAAAAACASPQPAHVCTRTHTPAYSRPALLAPAIAAQEAALLLLRECDHDTARWVIGNYILNTPSC